MITHELHIEKVTGNLNIVISATQIEYAITYNLTNCKSNNSLISIKENSSYRVIFTANDGYKIDTASVKILMDGVDITSLAYNMVTHELYIDKVTGNIDITISAK
jgi:hypothetical protein